VTDTIQPHLLLVDDDREFAGDMAAFLAHRFSVEMVHDGTAALASAAARRPDLVLLDIDLGRAPDGFAVLEKLRSAEDPPPIVMLTGAHRQDLEAVVRAIKGGAYHYVAKPPNIAELVNLAERALAEDDLRRRIDDLKHELAGLRGDMICEDPASLRLLKDLAKVAPIDGPVLITGESGTGKELVARRIHALSRRAAGPFQDVNCPAIPETLIESELFGHVKGSYTGATRDRLGKVVRATGGSLFLDEIGSCGDPFQSKLLRFLEEGTFDRVGDDRKTIADVRVLAATRVDLSRAMAEGCFREDLYYRLNAFQIHIPPLRERPGDIVPQAMAFLHQAASSQRKSVAGFSPAALEMLAGYGWPGNSRELRNTVERAVVFCEGETIGAGDLTVGPQGSETVGGPYKEAKIRLVADFNRRYLAGQLQRADGHIGRASELSDLPHQTFRRLMKDVGLEAEDHRNI